MFRFWASDARGCEKTAESLIPSAVPTLATTVSETPAVVPPRLDRPPKRRRSSSYDDVLPMKRAKAPSVALLSPQSPFPEYREEELYGPRHDSLSCDLETARETINHQFGLEILLKHDELRLINQELAKCQIALEQLRRCHLIPYPVSCPTPAQMLDISSGKGPALQTLTGEPVPKWAPPFGVVDGPYARHYAKWLIPDPMFDGIQPEPQGLPYSSRTKNAAAEGRTTRNSLTDMSALPKGRPGRGSAGQKLHSLSSGYPSPKDKQGPCILKRSDGQTVKLICIDCQRWDFSSTQGFINHCRIAHKRDFKSHDEAAVHCGHPIEVDEAGGIVGDEKPATTSSFSRPFSGLVHPFARNDAITDQQAYAALSSRIKASLELYHAGKLPNVKSIPSASTKPRGRSNAKAPTSFTGAPTTPYLSQMLQKKHFSGNLGDYVNDAKTKVDLDEMSQSDADGEDADHASASDAASTPVKSHAPAARAPIMMRVPARTVVSPVPLPTIPGPTSSKSRTPQLPFTGAPEDANNDVRSPSYDDEMDLDLSPNTMASNNAPSLVSDDGEYDDSDDGSSSDTSNGVDEESVSDVAEINVDEDNEVHEHGTPRPMRHHRSNSATTVKLRKEEAKHVTFVTPITGNTGKTKGRRKQKI